jgi:hypothetical protein
MLQRSIVPELQEFTPDEREEIEVFLRYFERKHLGGELRDALMDVVVDYARRHGHSPRSLCPAVHEQMNLNLQGVTAREFRRLNNLPFNCYIRDYFELKMVRYYALLNEHVEELVLEDDVHPVDAVKQVCARILPRRYRPQPQPIVENINSAMKRVTKKRAARTRSMPQQQTIPGLWGEAS